MNKTVETFFITDSPGLATYLVYRRFRTRLFFQRDQFTGRPVYCFDADYELTLDVRAYFRGATVVAERFGHAVAITVKLGKQLRNRAHELRRRSDAGLPTDDLAPVFLQDFLASNPAPIGGLAYHVDPAEWAEMGEDDEVEELLDGDAVVARLAAQPDLEDGVPGQ